MSRQRSISTTLDDGDSSPLDPTQVASTSKPSLDPLSFGSSRLKPGEELLDEATQAKILLRRQRDAARKRREKEVKRVGTAEGGGEESGAARAVRPTPNASTANPKASGTRQASTSEKKTASAAANSKAGPTAPTIAGNNSHEKKTQVVIAPVHEPSEDEDEEIEEEEEQKAYCICKGTADDRVMIACDRCDDWYHAACLKIKEEDTELIDMFICPRCEKETPERTTWKPQCSRQSCTSAARPPISRYCSDRCGVLVAASKLGKTKYIKEPEKLLNRPEVKGSRKKEGQVIWTDDESDRLEDGMSAWFKALSMDEDGGSMLGKSMEAFGQEQEQILSLQAELKQLIASKESASIALDLVMARIKLLQLAEDRATVLPQLEVLEEAPSTAAKKSKTKNKGATGDPNTSGSASAVASVKTQPRCGYDERLSWDDESFSTWAHSAVGEGMLKEEQDLDGLLLSDLPTNESNDAGQSTEPQGLPGFTSGPKICGVAKRKCRRHAEWTNIRSTDFEAEKEAQTHLLTTLSTRSTTLQSLITELQTTIQAKRLAEDEKIAMKLALSEGGGGTGARVRGLNGSGGGIGAGR